MLQFPPLDIRNVATAARLAELLVATDPAAPDEDFSTAADLIGGASAIRVRQPGSFPLPRWSLVASPSAIVVGCLGIRGLGDGGGVFLGSSTAPYPGDPWGANWVALRGASALLDILSTNFPGGARAWVLAGHSYGGAVSFALAALLLGLGVARSVQVITYGSPRPGNRGLAELLADWPTVRYMCDTDPVPRFPLKAWESPTVAALLPSATRDAWQQYEQPAGGLVLDDQGGIKNAALPELPTFSLPASLGAQYLFPETLGSPAHLLTRYRNRLLLAEARARRGGGQLTVGSASESVSLAAGGIVRGAIGGPAIPVSVIGGTTAMVGQIPVEFRPMVVNLGANTFAVSWMQQVVLVGNSRSNANTARRWLFAWLRRMQGVNQLDSAALALATSQYLAVAAQGALGFEPPLNVV